MMDILFNLVIGPLNVLFELVFTAAYRIFQNPFLVLVSMSIVVNLFALPLYKRADAIQEEENKKQAEMKPWLDHIKKTFKGDERYMMTTAYYRTQNYKTLSALRGSISLVLQIPFFIAAYNFLSNLAVIKTMSFWVFKNLGEPDRLLQIGGFTVNVLPILMTLLNICSAVIYLRGSTVSQKIQTYALALFFLVLLYNSPSGLVIYWTCNQVFSLLKNVFMKLVKSRVVLGICVYAAGLLLFLTLLLTGRLDDIKKTFLLLVILIASQMPLLTALADRAKDKSVVREKTAPQIKPLTFFLSGIFLTVFIGAVIPLSVIGSSPTEFVSYGNTPVTIIINTLSLTAGFFIVWAGVFYFLSRPAARNVFAYVFISLIGMALVNFFFYGRNLGFVSEYLVYDDKPNFSMKLKVTNLLIVIAVIVVACLIMRFCSKLVPYMYMVLIMGAFGMVITNSVSSTRNIDEANMAKGAPLSEAVPEFELSRNGKNVIVLFIDRAAAIYMPYALNERPELMQQFSGFTFYENTLCYGSVTYEASPAMLGGYDYLPARINAENDSLIIEKQKEAWDVIPYNLSKNGFRSTLADTFYLDTYYAPFDTSYFDKTYENTKTIELEGKYVTDDLGGLSRSSSKLQNRSFFLYSIMKILPVWGQNTLYDDGSYYSADSYQYTTDSFLKQYSELDALPYVTGITDSDENTYLFIKNTATHQPTVLDPVTYKPTAISAIDMYGDTSRFTVNGKTIRMDTESQIGHYNTFMASLIQIGEWMEYLKQEGVYDNTRIIIVSDHGNGCSHFSECLISKTTNIIRFNPLLMVKDFGSTEWTISDEYMTNADLPLLVFEGLVEDPINPATGEVLTDDGKYGTQYIAVSSKYSKAQIMVDTQIKADNSPWGVFEASEDCYVLDPSRWSEIKFKDIDFEDLY